MSPRIFGGIIFSVIFIMAGCNQDASSIMPYWSDLQPWAGEERFYSALDQLDEYLVTETNRIQAIMLVRETLKAKRISFKDQFRLATVVGHLQKHTQKREGEVREVYSLIMEGKSHIDYYGLVVDYPVPAYITASFDLFTNKQDLIAHSFNPDGGAKISYSIQAYTLEHLRKVTKQKYDANYDNWMNWWEREGRHLDFDYEEMEYMYPSAKRRL